MKKIKRFKLNQGLFLSSSEMTKLNGGIDLADTCTANNVGAPCLYGGPGSHATGICTYFCQYESNGNTTSIYFGYRCEKD